jgi:hypothetical protein
MSFIVKKHHFWGQPSSAVPRRKSIASGVHRDLAWNKILDKYIGNIDSLIGDIDKIVTY